MRKRGRVDDNQPEIVRALRKVGATVESMANLGCGLPDILVGFQGETHLMEIKDGAKPPSKRKLTKDEEKFFGNWRGGSLSVVESIEDAMAVIGVA